MNEINLSPETLESLKFNIMPTGKTRDENNNSAIVSKGDEDRQVPSVNAFYEESKRGATLAEVSVNKTRVTALIDSGATRSIAPVSLAKSLGLNVVPNGRKWLLADNSTLGGMGTAPVTLKIGKSEITHELVFTETLGYELIIGVDVLMSLGCK